MDKFEATLGHGTGHHFETLHTGHFTFRKFLEVIKPHRDLALQLFDGSQRRWFNGHEVHMSHVTLAMLLVHIAGRDDYIETTEDAGQQLDGGRYHDYNLDSTMYYIDRSAVTGTGLFRPMIGIETMYTFDGPVRQDVAVQILLGRPMIEITDRKVHA